MAWWVRVAFQADVLADGLCGASNGGWSGWSTPRYGGRQVGLARRHVFGRSVAGDRDR